jgi:hypothetical protein
MGTIPYKGGFRQNISKNLAFIIRPQSGRCCIRNKIAQIKIIKLLIIPKQREYLKRLRDNISGDSNQEYQPSLL